MSLATPCQITGIFSLKKSKNIKMNVNAHSICVAESCNKRAYWCTDRPRGGPWCKDHKPTDRECEHYKLGYPCCGGNCKKQGLHQVGVKWYCTKHLSEREDYPHKSFVSMCDKCHIKIKTHGLLGQKVEFCKDCCPNEDYINLRKAKGEYSSKETDEILDEQNMPLSHECFCGKKGYHLVLDRRINYRRWLCTKHLQNNEDIDLTMPIISQQQMCRECKVKIASFGLPGGKVEYCRYCATTFELRNFTKLTNLVYQRKKNKV